MATLSTKSLSQIVASWTAAAQAAATKVLNFSPGSVNLAIAEGGATIGLWLQRVALQVLAQSRFATSFGADAESWGAQFSYFKLDAAPATGVVTFSRSDTSAVANIPIGSAVQTTDGSQTFNVYADTGNPAYDSVSGAYIMAIGVASLDVPVQAEIAGIIGNVLAGTITVTLSTLAGLAVTNAAAFLNGMDRETDAAFKARFPLFLAGLARANEAAIASAVAGVQQNIRFFLKDNFNLLGSAFPFFDRYTFFNRPGIFAYPTPVFQPGIFLVLVDDGSGHPSADLLKRVGLAVKAVKGFTVQYRIVGPVVVTAVVSFAVTIRPGFDRSSVEGKAATVVTDFINRLPLGTKELPLTRIAQVVYDGVFGVSNVSDVMINGVVEDLVLNFAQIPRAGSVEVN